MKLVKQAKMQQKSLSGAANETGQAVDNATTSKNSSNPLEMLMNLFKGQK